MKKLMAVRVEIQQRCELRESAKEAIRIAGQFNVPVVFAHNGHDVYVDPVDCTTDVVDRFIKSTPGAVSL